MFSVNDFDETLPGPFEWDLKRLVASCAVAGRANGFSPQERAVVNLAVGRSYREAMSGFAQMRTLDTWYARLDADELRREWEAGATKAEKKRLEHNLAKSRTKDSMKAFDKLTHLVDGEPRIISDPPLIVPIDELLGPDQAQTFVDAVRAIIRSYRRSLPADRRLLLERFRYVDCARKVVGVGSVGTRAWVVLMIGNDGDDPLFLQIKEAEASVLEPFVGKSKFAQPRPAGRGGTAAHADGQRHHAGLVPQPRHRRRRPVTSTSDSCGTARHPRSSRRCPNEG